MSLSYSPYSVRGIGFFIVGLPDSAIKESQQRIEAALVNNKYKVPRKKIVVNMAPADIRKEGSAYDLTIAIGILAADEHIKNDKIGDYIIMGELSLDGGLHPIKGALPIAIEALKQGFKGFTNGWLVLSQSCIQISKYHYPHLPPHLLLSK